MQQMTSLTLSANRRESVVRGTPGFPCAAYFSDIALFPASMVSWHWHEEIELSMVVGGAARVRTRDGEFVLRAGEGMFINTGALHAFDIVGDEGCRMIMLVLDHTMLCGSEDSVFAKRYVHPLISSGAVKLIPLSPGVEWQKAVLSCLREAFLIYDEGRYGFELLVRARLTECLFHIVQNAREAMRAFEGAEGAGEERVKQMLDFIHLNHAQPISLDDIAQSATSESASACARSKKTLGIRRSRMSCATGVRLGTAPDRHDRSIADICFEVGFNSQSHYGQIFKRYFLCTPREYRERMRRL